MLLADHLYNELCWVSKLCASVDAYSPSYGRVLQWLRVVREGKTLAVTASDSYRVHFSRLTVGAESERCETWLNTHAASAVKGFLKDAVYRVSNVVIDNTSLRLTLGGDTFGYNALTVSSLNPDSPYVKECEKLSAAFDQLLMETTRVRASVKVKGKYLLEECKDALKAHKDKSVRFVLQSSPKLVVDPEFLVDALPKHDSVEIIWDVEEPDNYPVAVVYGGRRALIMPMTVEAPDENNSVEVLSDVCDDAVVVVVGGK